MEDRFDVAVGPVDRDVAAPPQVLSRNQGDIRNIAVPRRAGGNGIPGVTDDPLKPAAVVIVLVLAELVIELDALEVVEHQEIDHPGHRVGPVGRRGAAGQHLDALDQRAGDLVDIGADPAPDRRAGRHAPAVDQHQRPRRAQVAQVQGGRAGGAVGYAGVLRGEHLRQEAQRILHPDVALIRQGVRVDVVDGTGADQIGNVDAGPGHHHFFQSHRRVGRRILRQLLIRSQTRRGNDSQQQCRTHHDSFPRDNLIRHAPLLLNLYRHALSFLPQRSRAPFQYTPGTIRYFTRA